MSDDDVRTVTMPLPIDGRALAIQVIKERDDARRELADTRAILSDLLTERNESWLAQLVGRREELVSQLRNAENVGDYNICGWCSDRATQSENNSDGLHRRECPLAELLRVVGGEVEVQRQVDAAHKAALAERQRLIETGYIDPTNARRLLEFPNPTIAPEDLAAWLPQVVLTDADDADD